MTETTELPERESMEFDVVIVGAGPAGLSAAIRLKQVNPELSVVVLEKGAGSRRAYPVGRRRRSDRHRPAAAGLAQPKRSSVQDRGDRRPFPGARSGRLDPLAECADAALDEQSRQLHRLAWATSVAGWPSKAEELGVEIYPGFAATEVLYNDERCGHRGRHRRHGHREERRARPELCPRHGTASANTR